MDSACCEFILVWSSNLKNELKKKITHITFFILFLSCSLKHQDQNSQ